MVWKNVWGVCPVAVFLHIKEAAACFMNRDYIRKRNRGGIGCDSLLVHPLMFNGLSCRKAIQRLRQNLQLVTGFLQYIIEIARSSWFNGSSHLIHVGRYPVFHEWGNFRGWHIAPRVFQITSGNDKAVSIAF